MRRLMALPYTGLMAASMLYSDHRSRPASRRHHAMMRAVLYLFALSVMALASPARAFDGDQQFAELGRCKLASGQVIEECRVGYRTFGTLNAARDNAVLMPTWLYGKSSDLISLFGDGSSPQ